MKLQGVGGTPTLSALNRDLIVDKQTRLARTILNGFTAYFAEFENITLAARTRFELAEWGIMQEISTRRIDLYKEKVLETLAYVNVIADDRISDFVFWTETRAVYVELVRGMTNFEIAETFYNSITLFTTLCLAITAFAMNTPLYSLPRETCRRSMSGAL